MTMIMLLHLIDEEDSGSRGRIVLVQVLKTSSRLFRKFSGFLDR
jgi:hypothetical protein